MQAPLATPNLWVCDNSAFPSALAAKPAQERIGFGGPESACDERALLALHPGVAVHERSARESVCHRIARRDETPAVIRAETRREKKGRIQSIGPRIYMV